MLQLGKVYLMDDFIFAFGVVTLTVGEVLNKYDVMLDHYEPYIGVLTVFARFISIISGSIFIYSKWKSWRKNRNEKPK
jgi:hypothetical protein